MEIIIVGSGKIGSTVAEQLSRSGHNITIIDSRPEPLQKNTEYLDVMTVEGNGASHLVLKEAGAEKADLLIAATSADELNLLCCLIAKKLGTKHTIARVRNPEYSRELELIKDDLGLSLSVNPELACATEMARILRIPSAIKIDTFARGRVELLKFSVTPDSPLAGMQLTDLGKFQAKVLICIVERGEDKVYIPSGNFQLAAGDKISIVASPHDARTFLRRIHVATNPVQQVLIVGAGRIGYYLARQLLDAGAKVKLVDSDRKRCELVSQLLPQATVIHGDGTDQNLLREIGLEHTDAFASLTGIDEENILLSLYAHHVSHAKIITKINRTSFTDVINSMDLGSVFYPRYIAADTIGRYVRAMENSLGSNVETLYKLVGGKAEALEFRVTASSALCGVPLQKLPLRNNLLIGCINRRGRTVIPKGSDTVEPGDTVVVVTTIPGLNDLDDILDRRKGSLCTEE